MTAPLSDLGSAALDKASELTSTAAELVPDLPEQVGRLARRARRRLHPTPTRSRWRPVLLIVAAVGAALVLVAWLRRSNASDDKDSAMSPREQSERAAIAAVS